MKKILLSFIITTITCLSVNATYSVQYNNAGSASNTGNTFGSNAKLLQVTGQKQVSATDKLNMKNNIITVLKIEII